MRRCLFPLGINDDNRCFFSTSSQKRAAGQAICADIPLKAPFISGESRRSILCQALRRLCLSGSIQINVLIHDARLKMLQITNLFGEFAAADTFGSGQAARHCCVIFSALA